MGYEKKRKGWRFVFFVTVRFLVMIFIADTVWAMNVQRSENTKNVKQYDALKILQSMKQGYNSVESYTAILVKGEEGAGTVNEPQKIFVKFKKPFKVYMKWMENAHAGREVLYVQGENDDQFFAKPDGMLGAFVKTMKLPSDYKSDGSDHTVKDVGIGRFVDVILDIAMKAKENNELNLVCKGVVMRSGRVAYEIERVALNKDRSIDKRVVLFVDKKTNLPLEAYTYDGKGKLCEFYQYQIVKLNPSLKDDEFSVENKEYGFRDL